MAFTQGLKPSGYAIGFSSGSPVKTHKQRSADVLETAIREFLEQDDIKVLIRALMGNPVDMMRVALTIIEQLEYNEQYPEDEKVDKGL